MAHFQPGGNRLRPPQVPLLLRENQLRLPHVRVMPRGKHLWPPHAHLALRGNHLRSPQVNIPLRNGHYRLGLPVLGRREPWQRTHHRPMMSSVLYRRVSQCGLPFGDGD